MTNSKANKGKTDFKIKILERTRFKFKQYFLDFPEKND